MGHVLAFLSLAQTRRRKYIAGGQDRCTPATGFVRSQVVSNH